MLNECFGGLDFGSSGARIVIIEPDENIIYQRSCSYKYEFQNPQGWLLACFDLMQNIPIKIKRNLSSISISGTSGTILPCKQNGDILGNSIPYNKVCDKKLFELNLIAGKNKFLNNPFSSLAKALYLIDIYGKDILLRHQSDWIAGWFLNNWQYGEASNNLKLGWDMSSESWPKIFNSISFKNCLPKIRNTGDKLGKINLSLAKELGINDGLWIIAGTTDSNAAFIASQVEENEGLTILGTTIALKKIIKKPFQEAGISIHKVQGSWICGGSSNAGCGILSKYFSDIEIEELSKQINPSKKTNLNFLPLNSIGERFPVNNPLLEPILKPRPVSDALFLQGLLEGLANIELKGWKRLQEITGSFPNRIITIGGGAKNPQWRSIRKKIMKIPIISSNKTTAFGSALISLHAEL